MTTVLGERAPASPPNARPSGPVTAILALAKVEGGRLLRHPAVLVAFALSVSWAVYGLRGTGHPVLQHTVRDTQLGMLAVAAGAILAAHLAASRPYRDGTDELFDVLLMPAWQRTVALLAATVPLALVSAVLVAAHVAVYAGRSAAVGVIDVGDVLTGPVVVLFGAVAGVLLGRCTRAVVAGPLLLVGLAALTLYASFSNSPLRWLAPVVLRDEQYPLPGDLIGRPAGWHLLYLILLTAALAAGALAVRRTGRDGVRPALVAGVAMVGALALLIPQAAAPGERVEQRRQEAMERPAASQECRSLDAVTYCAFPDFTGLVPGWAELLEAVREPVPGPARSQITAVRQRVNTNATDLGGLIGSAGADPVPAESWKADDTRAGTPDTVPVGTGWGDGQAELDFAAAVAYRIVTGGQVTAAPPEPLCGGRAVVILWLAAQATAQTRDGFDYRLAHSTGGLLSTPVPGFDAQMFVEYRETSVVRELLAQPVAATRQRVTQAWTQLIDPGTTTEQAARTLGVPAGRADEQGQCR
ncbi:hypothetical protein [Actinoplanes sp. M2I2]|uniref:hypothetical protein n=1 Tax=Actinoplanes sp. M2I2 TaxID=1734444 RepID=UPI002021AC5F|nr:hypothetical protein [Actinoplanes sp. M2I2]